MKRIVPIFLGLFSVFFALAQPTITSFAPQSGAVGAAITITGTGFSATAANNAVFFGATKATVTAASATSLTATVPAGATYQPISVTVAGLTAWSANRFRITFSGAGGIGPTSLIRAGTFYSAGTVPSLATRRVHLADVDLDGKTDMIVSTTGVSTISIFRNTSTSSGSLGSDAFVNRLDLTTTAGTTAVKVADIDGDGKPDVTCFTGATLSVFRNIGSPGSIVAGSFATRVDLIVNAESGDFELADLNNDGKLDFAAPGTGSNVVTARNTSTVGSVSFLAASTHSAGADPQSIASGDIDGDGKRDLIIGSTASNSIRILKNNTTTVTSFSGSTGFASGTGTGDVFVGDLDLDGKPDITAVSSFTLSVFRNTSTVGVIDASSLATRVDFSPPSENPIAVAASDIDGDGRPDLAVLPKGSDDDGFFFISVFRNISTPGSFTTSSLDSPIKVKIPYYGYNLAMGDLDGDSRPDLVYSEFDTPYVNVYFNNTAVPSITSVSPTSGAAGGLVTITGASFDPTPSNNIVSFGGVRASVVSSTNTSMTITVPNGAAYAQIGITRNGRTGSSPKPFTPIYPSNPGLSTQSFATKSDFQTGGNNPQNIASGDIDLDGKVDIVVANSASNTIGILKNTSTPGGTTITFASPVTFATPGPPNGLAIGDIDGDGKPDVVVTSSLASGNLSIFRNTATTNIINTSTLAARVDFTAPANPTDVAISDLDLDGRPELVTTSTSSIVSVYRNTSTVGAISSGSLASKVDLTSIPCNGGVTVADFNGDRLPDIIVANQSGSNVSAIENLGSIWGQIGTLSFRPKADFTTGLHPAMVAFADLNLDGRLEVATPNFDGTTITTLRNISGDNASVILSSGVTHAVTATTFPAHIAMSDLDGDGRVDMLLTNRHSRITAYQNTSVNPSVDQVFSTTTFDFGTSSDPYASVVVDLNADGKPDVATVCSNISNPGVISVFRNTVRDVPTITSVTPTVGDVNTTITITGKGFDPTAAENEVVVGGVPATVQTASLTQLTVKPKAGATNSPITITSEWLTANANESFVHTFASSGILTGTTFPTTKSFTYPSTGFVMPSDMDIGDINNDGLLDVVFAQNASPVVTILPGSNNSDGRLFEARVDLGTGFDSGPWTVAIADANGDGLPEIISANMANNTISIFKHTNSGLAISDFSRVDIQMPLNYSLDDLQVEDLDGDGKLDLITTRNIIGGGPANYGILILRKSTISNTEITPTAYDPPMTISLGTSGGTRDLVVKDINGDRKPDLVFNNSNDNSFSVMLNTSSAGNVSFATKIDFPTLANPFNLAFGDVDGDGKPDVIVTVPNSNLISVYRNIQSGVFNSSSFAARVDFAVTYPQYVTLGDVTGDGKLDVIVGGDENVVFKNISTSGSFTTGSLATKVAFSANSRPNPKTGDLNRDGRTDIVALSWGSETVTASLNNIATFNSASDIIIDPGFTYATNIPYADFTTSPVTHAQSVEVGRFILRDGGGTSDNDPHETRLTNLNLNLTGGLAINKLALFDGTTKLAEVSPSTPTTASFTGLAINAPDNGTKTFSLRATFNTAVTDNTQTSFTISSAGSLLGFSQFASANGGGATTSTAGNNNRIEVTATKVSYSVAPPALTAVSTDVAPQVKAIAADGNNNRDLDYTGAATVTNTASLAMVNIPTTFASGELVFPTNFQFTAHGTTSLKVESGGLTQVTSSPIVVRASEPTSQPSSMNLNVSVTGGIEGSFTASAPPADNYLVVYGTAAPTGVPTDGTIYAINTGLGDGTIASITGTSFATVPLNPDTRYFFAAFAYNGTEASSNFLASAPLTNNKLTRPAKVVAQEVIAPRITEFTAKWGSTPSATQYLLYLSTSKTFDTHIPNYNGKQYSTTQAEVTGLVADTEYYFRIKAVNESGEGPASEYITVKTLPQTATALSIANPVVNTTASTVSVTVAGGSGARTVKYYSKGILAANFGSPTSVTSTTDTYTVSYTETQFDELGLECNFTVEDATTTSPLSPEKHGYVFRPVAANSKAIPGLSFGGEVSNYRIISIPYKLINNDVSPIFGFLGEYETKWRLIRYDKGKNIDYGSFTKIEPGLGYWFNGMEAAEVFITPGTTVEATLTTHFPLSLAQGWNQVGNPFPFDIDWDDIKAFNPGKAVGNLKVFVPSSGTFTDANTIKPWTGGFVLADNAVQLSLPVTLKNTAGRRASPDIQSSDLASNEWMLPMTLHHGPAENSMIGVGMHPEALLGKDVFDDIEVPRFFRHLELNTRHPEFFEPKFSRDVVPTSQTQTWRFYFSSSFGEEEALLNWNPANLGSGDERLILFDRQQQMFIDMKSASYHRFRGSSDYELQVIFSKNHDWNPGVTMMGRPYPNPSSSSVSIPIALSQHANIIVDFFDATGKKVQTLGRSANAGLHTLEWDGNDETANRVAAGLYLVRMRTNDGIQTQKVIIK